MKIIILLIATLLFTFYTALIDAEHYEKGHFVKSHTSRWMQRFAFVMAVAAFDIVGAVAAALLFTVLFDQVLNELRKLPTFYFGTVSKWDIFWHNNLTFYILVNMALLTGAVLLVIYALNNLW